jgi:glycosyltransferase involved in cell wall biosynthesis
VRFLMLTTFYPPWSFGGDANLVHDLSHELAARGHDVTVAHSIASYRLLEGSSSPPLDAVRDDDGVRIVVLDEGLGPLAPLATYVSGRPALLRRRIERLLRERFDVIHFHNPSLLGAPAVFGAGAAVKLLTLHDYWLVCPMNLFTRNRRELCTKPTCIRCSLAHRRPPQPWRYTRLLPRSLSGLDALLATSRTSARLHAALEPHVQIEHLPNFVHPDPGIADGANRHFLFVGRLEPMKGPQRLLPVFADRPDDPLVVAGKGGIETALQRRATSNVHFTGRLDRSELDALYRDATAVLMPTVGQESCPLVLLEAQARGIPVIGSDHGALRELIAGGLLFENDRQLHESLDRVADADVRSALARDARAAYLERYTLERHLTRYFEVISRFAGARGDDRLASEASAAA